MKLYLIRHGEEYKADTEVHGHMDVPLSARGFEQSKDLVSKLMTQGIKRIYSSDLTRAIQTALPFSQASGLGINATEDLRPIKLGEYEGKDFEEIKNDLKHWQDTWVKSPSEAIPGGDSFKSFQDRNLSFFRKIVEDSENDDPIAVFTHSRNCHLVQHLAARNFTPLTQGIEDILHHCDHELGTYKTYQIDRTSNLTRLTNQGGQRGKSFSMRFIEPGLVRYDEVGDVLVEKPCLDEMASSFVGCPVFDRTHKDTTEKDFTSGKADGIITRVWTDPNDGWHWCEALIWDPETLEHMRDGYGLSCAYDVLKWTNISGTWHNIPYENEIAKGRYTHMAIVKNPRYERVSIIANQGGNTMKLMFCKKDKEGKTEEKPSEVELVNAVVPLDGKDIPLEKVLELAGAELKRQELANAKKGLEDDEIVEVGGKKMPFKEAKELASAALKNEAANSMAEDHKDGKHKDKKLEDCGQCSNELANEKAEAEKKAKELKNAKEKEDAAAEQKRLEDLRNAKNKGNAPKMPEGPRDQSDRLKVGNEQYGPLPTLN